MTDCVTLSECSRTEGARLLAQAERIFFETADRKTFELAAAKRAFLQRWFGNYADAHPDAFLFALDENRDVTGYVAGGPDSFSPASKIVIGDIHYFTRPFARRSRTTRRTFTST